MNLGARDLGHTDRLGVRDLGALWRRRQRDRGVASALMLVRGHVAARAATLYTQRPSRPSVDVACAPPARVRRLFGHRTAHGVGARGRALLSAAARIPVVARPKLHHAYYAGSL